jgi:hypothetical protein
MKAFLAGLIFILAVVALSGIGILLYPFLLVLSIALRIALGCALIILAIWLLGKFIIFVWESLFKKK